MTARPDPEVLDLLLLSAHEALDEGVVIGDGGRVLHVNDAACRLYGRTNAELLAAQSLFGFLAPDEQERIQALVDDRIASGEPVPKRFETVVARPDGTAIHVEMSTIAMVQEVSVRTLTLIRDIGERHSHEAELERLALHDALTGLPNRRLLTERMAQIAARAARAPVAAALFLVDLDAFKRVNDKHGHEAGDRVLRGIADALRVGLRDGDTAARLGGDEFVVVGERIGDDIVAQRLATRLAVMIARPITLADGTEISMRASIGINRFGAEPFDPGEILREADAAMYRVKPQRRAQRPDAAVLPLSLSARGSRPRPRRAHQA